MAGAIGNFLRVDKTGGGQVRWARCVQGHTTNLYRGTFGGGTPFAYNETCFVTESTGTQTADATNPAPGSGFYYLVAAKNCCG